MKKISLCITLMCLFVISGRSQTIPFDSAALKIYRGSPPKINDLVHTKLELSLDYEKCYVYGKAWITCKPHGFSTDSLTLVQMNNNQ